MPSATTHGYPYPLGTDRVQDGDDVIHSLADKVEAQVAATASGTVTVTTTAADTIATTAVTFPAGRFPAGKTPRVFLQQQSQLPGATGNYSAMWSTAVTNTGFTANCRRWNAAACAANWFATDVDV